MTKTDLIFSITFAVLPLVTIVYAITIYDYSAGGSLMMFTGGLIGLLMGFYDILGGGNSDF